MITRETDYAIRTVVCLAGLDGGVLMSTADLAASTGVPYRFLRKIVSRLASVGLVHTRRGKGGGLRLAPPAEAIDLLALLQMIEPESVLLNRCTADERIGCQRIGVCTVHDALLAVQNRLWQDLAAIRLDHLVPS